MRARTGLRLSNVLSLVCLALSLGVAAPGLAQEGDRLTETLDDAPAATPADPAEASPPDARPALPPLPSEEELKALLSADPRFARPILRRAARTAPDPRRRALGLAILARRDPTRATARICARALRIDVEPRVRRAAAECLGRLPPEVATSETPTLVAALDDASLDVRTMAGWALANVGDVSALAQLTKGASDDDPRAARLFYDYTLRLRARHGLRLREAEEEPPGPRLVPPADAVIVQADGLQLASSTAWLALYGGMAGWLHGGFFPSAHGGPGFQQISALTALGGAVAGVAVGGAYGFFGTRRLTLAHTVVQLGAFGTVAGYGAGILSDVRPVSGLNMASFSLVGTLVGTGMGVALVNAVEPTPGALGLGLTVGLGTAISFTSLGLGYDLPLPYGLAVGLFTGGIAGSVTTILAGPYPIGLFPITGATLGGLTLATLTGFTVGIVEGAQLGGQARPFTEGTGWAVAGGYVVGAVVGGGLTQLLPEDLDPFRGGLTLQPPTVAFVDDKAKPGTAVPVALLSGTF